MIKREELTNPRSCMSRAEDDELTFVLLGRDVAAPTAIIAWCVERIRLGKNKIDDPQIVEANACANAMRFWRDPELKPSAEQAPADLIGLLQEHSNAYIVYQCSVCGKSKPNPYVIFAKGWGCECQTTGSGQAPAGQPDALPTKESQIESLQQALYENCMKGSPMSAGLEKLVCYQCDELRSQLAEAKRAMTEVIKTNGEVHRQLSTTREIARELALAVRLTIAVLHHHAGCCIGWQPPSPCDCGRQDVIDANEAALAKARAAGLLDAPAEGSK